jgi:1,4-dihydroxy-2-naphthoyl-CoA hydrolase
VVSPYTYERCIYFRDTDSAGVVYFVNLLHICHEAYEASLRSTGGNLRDFFSMAEIAVPIIHSEIDFFMPVYLGDLLLVKFTAQAINSGVFQLDYQLFKQGENDLTLINNQVLVAKAMTKHSCIDRITRQKCDIPKNLQQWLVQWSKISG